jgi:type IV secretory pathway VirB6-like protein
MHFTKKIKHILLLVFLVSILGSCDRGCYEADEFYSKVFKIGANPKKEDVPKGVLGTKIGDTKSSTQNVFGSYDQHTGGQMSDWMDTGLIANGDYFVISISGGWTDKGGERNESQISALPSCRYCIKSATGSSSDNCLCGPVLDDAKMKNGSALHWDEPKTEEYKIDASKNDSTCYFAKINPQGNLGIYDTKTKLFLAGNSQTENTSDINICTCQNPTIAQKTAIFENNGKGYFIFPRGSILKTTTNLNSLPAEAIDNKEQDCAHKMGFGAYISLNGPAELHRNYTHAYHLASPNRVLCPIKLNSKGECKDASGIDRTKFIYSSPNKQIFAQSYDPSGNPIRFHGLGDKVRLIIYDKYFSDNSGSYKVEFMRGVISTKEGGLIADIVRTIDGYIFGSSVYNKNTFMYTKEQVGVVEFMYKAIMNDKLVKAVISISLVMYVCFYGLAFFMGLVDYGKKEVAMRLLKIALVILFTNEKSWLFYNDFVVGFFKDGMDTFVATITNIFESNMDKTLGAVMVSEEALSVQNDVGRKFMYVDNMILNLTSNAVIAKVIGLIFIPGKGIFGILYAIIIFALIYYFIYAMIDIALKYLINVLKLCIGFALGPVFILFSLFEKTKDMFKNWLAFIGARSFEIIILFTMLHPFLLIIDQSFTEMLTFSVCSEDKNNGVMTYTIHKSQDLNRGIYEWVEFFIRIGALLFITKSIANQAGYISGQLITIGGVANADAVTDVGRGDSGFSMASSMAKGIVGVAKSAVTSKYVGGVAAMAGRVSIRTATSGLRANIGSSGSINDIVNNAFKSVGIRNRGIRSYMRDRQVDNALSLAGQRANDMGLVGTEKDAFVRQEAMTSLNKFISENPNKAVLLGLDTHNIMKRFDQKLIKEPMKDFIKEKAAELKEQGIFGKEARDKIEASVQEWAKQNLPDYIPERKISEFMKKASVKSTLKTQTEMGATEAKNYAVNLIKEDRVDEAKQFIEKFRENAVSSELRRDKKHEASKIEGGKIVKGFVGGVNIASKVLRPVLLPSAYAAKKIYNWSPNITGRIGKNETVQKVVSKIGYGAKKIYNSKYSPNISGRLGVNNGRGLRAPKGNYEEYKKHYSDRKWGEGIGLRATKGTYKEYKKAYGLNASKVVIADTITNKKIRKFFGQVDNVVGGFKDHVMGMKIPILNPNGSPSRNPVKNLRKFGRKIERELGGLIEKQEKYDKKLNAPLTYGIDKDRIQEIDKKNEKLKAAIDKLGIKKEESNGVVDKAEISKKAKINTNFSLLLEKFPKLKIDKDDALYKKVGKGLVRIVASPLSIPADFIYNRTVRKFGKQGQEFKKIHKEEKMLALQRVAEKNINALQENIKNKFKERLVDEYGNKRGVIDDDRNKIIDNRRNKETDDLAVTLKMIEKRQKKELKKKEEEYVNKKFKELKLSKSNPSEKLEKNLEKEKLKKEFREKLKSEISDQDTILEKLIKHEYAGGGKDFTLKYAQELAKDGGAGIKQALFGNAKDVFEEKAGFGNKFKNAFDKAVLVASDSVVAGGDPTAVPDTENVASVKDDLKSNFDKNRIIASIIYNSIVHEEFDNLNKTKFHTPAVNTNHQATSNQSSSNLKMDEIKRDGIPATQTQMEIINEVENENED